MTVTGGSTPAVVFIDGEPYTVDPGTGELTPGTQLPLTGTPGNYGYSPPTQPLPTGSFIPVPQPGGGITGYLPSAIVPQPGTLTQYPIAGTAGQWSDVRDWIVTRFDAATPEPVNDTETTLLNDIRAALTATVEGLSGFINHAFNYAFAIAGEVNADVNALAEADGAIATTLQYFMNQQAATFQAELQVLSAVERDDYNRLLGMLNGVGPNVIALLQTWVMRNVFTPLDADIIRTRQELTNLIYFETQKVLNESKAYTDAKVSNLEKDVTNNTTDVTNVKNFMARLKVAVKFGLPNPFGSLWDWVTGGGVAGAGGAGAATDLPPASSDAGKALQYLSDLLTLLVGFAFAGVTQKDLEAVARAFGTIAEVGPDTLLSGFVRGGEPIGVAGAQILAELTGAARTALQNLGVPVP